MLLLIAGHETTANMIALGIATLLDQPDRNPDRWSEEKRADRVVEELLRFHAVIQWGLVRRATADLPIGDVLIRTGDWVVCSLAYANRDAAACPHAGRFDTGRPSSRQLSFGYGIHQCAGQNLARLELRIALSTLFRRFPGLRPAVPVSELPFRRDAWVYGLYALPVTW